MQGDGRLLGSLAFWSLEETELCFMGLPPSTYSLVVCKRRYKDPRSGFTPPSGVRTHAMEVAVVQFLGPTLSEASKMGGVPEGTSQQVCASVGSHIGSSI